MDPTGLMEDGEEGERVTIVGPLAELRSFAVIPREEVEWAVGNTGVNAGAREAVVSAGTTTAVAAAAAAVVSPRFVGKEGAVGLTEVPAVGILVGTATTGEVGEVGKVVGLPEGAPTGDAGFEVVRLSDVTLEGETSVTERAVVLVGRDVGESALTPGRPPKRETGVRKRSRGFPHAAPAPGLLTIE